MRDELAGFTIGVTADRRRDELAALLQRRGARVVVAPVLRIVPLADDTDLREATRACLDRPPDVLMANTGIGMRGWLEAAEGWAPPTDPAPMHRLIDLVAGRLVDAVTFTSAPAAEALLRAAGDRSDAVLDAFRGDVLASCVGAVTAEPLLRRGVPVTAPASACLGALVRTLVDELPRRTVTLKAAGHLLTLRGHAAVVDGVLRPLAPAPMVVLRALCGSPGRVLSRTVLLRTLPRGADEHAVEMAVARLRAGLRAPRVVQTVVKRGYRLRVD
ncbi:uroporphyrinogen-III synthase [Micromonospora peucetia]|uniref:Uroporphyrinogen-III synthase n=1 Tax=Micromonospora peucetia TaxID=47871 RepID=A0A1C6VA19_9ACTN|nr:uroporphyrinogen-III synthase [Micromonospora peucetia]MCX4389467.1 uroporphyrinogen-III synthase [Micromonospora peucetia]WSA29959.1 uroporphyrinogen-III synthase [Micromonospora peucetia]SCL63183.1 Uroporphyrinogen-III synthase HemD [Micromonospora peucetia]